MESNVTKLSKEDINRIARDVAESMMVDLQAGVYWNAVDYAKILDQLCWAEVSTEVFYRDLHVIHDEESYFNGAYAHELCVVRAGKVKVLCDLPVMFTSFLDL